MKIEPVQFKHPLMDNLPAAPSKEVLADLYNLMLLGDNLAKHQLIQHLLLVAKRCIGMILTMYPSSRRELDDMVGEAALIIVDRLDKLKRGARQVDKLFPLKISNYFAVVILQGVGNRLTENEMDIKIPSATHRLYYQTGKTLPVQFQNEVLDSIQASNCESDFEVREALETIISTPIEGRIVELREASYTDSEIGELLGVSRQTVTLLRFNLYQRYLEATQ